MYKAALVQLRAVVRRHGLNDQISMVCTAREGTFFFFFFFLLREKVAVGL